MSKTSALDFSMHGDQFLGRSYREMDCQQFVENCMKLVGIHDNLAGSNAWYRAMTWTGTPEECKAKFGSIPKGALLYILKQDGGEPAKYKPDGIGNASHIGIYIGRKDGAIHSSASRGMVCYSSFAGKSINGGWNRVGLWDRFDYGSAINAALTGQPQAQQTTESVVTIHMYQANVVSENGLGVNFRSSRSTSSSLLAKLPVGTEVTVSADDGTWSTVGFNGKTGYIMSKYLEAIGGASGEDISITLNRDTAEALYAALGQALTETGGVG